MMSSPLCPEIYIETDYIVLLYATKEQLSVTCVYRYQFLILECVSLLVLEYLCNDAVSFSAKMEFTIVSNCSRTYSE